MTDSCWSVWPGRGFLMQPDPLLSTRQALDEILPVDVIERVESIALDLPALLVSGRIFTVLEKLPVFDLSILKHEQAKIDCRAIERLMQIYSYFASAYVYGDPANSRSRIPAGVAVPLVLLAGLVERPPILSYSGYVLANWRRTTQSTPITVDNVRLIQNFLGTRDEAWFILIHVDIEARAAGALAGLMTAVQAADLNDTRGLEESIGSIIDGLRQMITTFHRMPEQCDPALYYHKVRPYIFGFTDVIYEGVEAFGNVPQTFRGQTGAQSSIIPALVSGLGLAHEQNTLTHHLEIMRDYMPRPHREFANSMRRSNIRECVQENSHRATLVETYNEALRHMVEFRSLHYQFATEYIFRHVANPLGTGGTVFMEWLKQLIVETEGQFVQATHAPSSAMR